MILMRVQEVPLACVFRKRRMVPSHTYKFCPTSGLRPLRWRKSIPMQGRGMLQVATWMVRLGFNVDLTTLPYQSPPMAASGKKRKREFQDENSGVADSFDYFKKRNEQKKRKLDVEKLGTILRVGYFYLCVEKLRIVCRNNLKLYVAVGSWLVCSHAW